MPKYFTNSAVFSALSGAIGDLVFYRDAEGNLIVQRRGARPSAPPSPKQIAQKERLKCASVYGNQVKTDPILAAEYRPLCRGRMTPYQAALRDYLVPPKVEGIDLESFNGQPGQLIRIIASDDTRVLTVQIVIRDAVTEAILEQGQAALSVLADQWLYTTTTAIPSGTAVVVEATATDRPGHTGTAKIQHLVPAASPIVPPP